MGKVHVVFHTKSCFISQRCWGGPPSLWNDDSIIENTLTSCSLTLLSLRPWLWHWLLAFILLRIIFVSHTNNPHHSGYMCVYTHNRQGDRVSQWTKKGSLQKVFNKCMQLIATNKSYMLKEPFSIIICDRVWEKGAFRSVTEFFFKSCTTSRLY